MTRGISTGQVRSEVGGGQSISADQYGLAALPRLAHPRVLGDWNVVDIGEWGLKQYVLSIDEIRGFVGRYFERNGLDGNAQRAERADQVAVQDAVGIVRRMHGDQEAADVIKCGLEVLATEA